MITSVAVIIPAWNCEKFLAYTLESITAQTIEDWVVIVVDDGSADSTFQVAQSFADLCPRMIVTSEKNSGPTVARAKGVELAPPSRYVYFLDADDILEQDALEILVAYLDANPKASMVHFDCSCIDQFGTPMRDDDVDFTPARHSRYVPSAFSARKLRPDEIPTPFISIYNLAGIIPSVAFLRRDAFEHAGGWDRRLKQMYEDTDLWLRMALVGEVHYLPRRLVRYRRHPGQSTDDCRRAEFSERLDILYGKWAVGENLNEAQMRLVQEAERFRRRGLAVHKNLELSRLAFLAGGPVQSFRYAYGALRALVGALDKSPDRI